IIYTLGVVAVLGAAPTSTWAGDGAADEAVSPTQLAVLPVMQVGHAHLPTVLSAADAARYQRIFALQDKAEWVKAEHEIAALEDRVLMGHILAQRYLHPSYRSKYQELKAWLAEYNDHHYAPRLYELALKRRPANANYPTKPATRVQEQKPNKAYSDSDGLGTPPGKNLSREQRAQVYRHKITLKTHLRKGKTLAAKQLLETADVQKLFSAYDMDWARERLARAYFMAGRDDLAVQWAEPAAKRSGKYLSQAHWTTALAYWRLGDMERAAAHFEKSAEYEKSPWVHTASAFWAARAHLVARHPERVMAWLEQAAQHPRTFYGMLATKLLGREPQFNWTLPPMDGADVRQLQEHDGGRRALALLQIGKDFMAEKELRQVAVIGGKDQAAGILAIAAQAGMAELAVRLDEMLHPDGKGYDGAAYPLPTWEPTGGFKVDRALVYALVRQESRFNPFAKSGAGASGLMQLMPGTAKFVARNSAIRLDNRTQLFDPETNLKLGQNYISILLNDSNIKGDLFLMAAAWNGGPGNLSKWRRKVDDLGDPLFFIESLPSSETRDFIERVVTNLWIYRYRLGQPASSLDEVASGVWPSYQALGKEPKRVAVNVED
ncbi:MAG: transglycosylase SLT domain-containing protein, partial [Rhodospirillales bacterium]|nr:transglycosylase SLT domain-containing protein [Rhodospirillales bacterium]